MVVLHVELRPDRSLLRSNFDGYKLSLESVPVLRDEHKTHQLPNRDYPNLETQYSFLHQELFSHHNLLVADPWTENSVFYVTTGNAIENCRFNGKISRSRKVFQLPGSRLRTAGDYNYSLQFISPEFLLVADGAGLLYVIATGERNMQSDSSSAWKLVHEEQVLVNEGCVIKDATLDMDGDRKVINAILLQIIPEPDCSEKFITKLIWIRLKENGDANWERNARKELHAKKTIVPYLSLTKGGHGFIVASQKAFRFVMDTEKDVPAADGGEKNGDTQLDYKAFSWSQSEEDVVVNFSALEDSSKSEFYVKCTATTIVVKFKELILLDSDLSTKIDPDLTTWQLQNDTLQVTMVKAQEGERWEHLIPNGPAETTDAAPVIAESFSSVPNLTAALEDCDRDDGEYYIEQLDEGTHSITHRIYLGSNAPLFTKQGESGRMIAIRHDVDTCLWRCEDNAEHWKHVGTLDAFGYVAASKQQRKFLDCSPDMNYSVICEPERHVFIYMNEYATAGGLRNRSGNQIKVGQQRLVALEETGEVLGCVAQNEITFLLTPKFMLCLKVKE